MVSPKFMQRLLKIILVPAFWLIFILTLRFNFPEGYSSIVQTFNVSELRWKVVGGLSQSYAEKLLTSNRNIFFWSFFKSKIVAPYLQDSIFKSVQLERCSFFNFYCYEIFIQARTPAFLEKGAAGVWLVDSEGVVLRKVQNLDSWDLPLVDLREPGLSPQVLNSRQRSAFFVIQEFKKVAGVTLRELSFTASGEVALVFAEYPFVLLLEPSFSEPDKLRTQLDRFRYILKDLGVALNAVARIDLAFDRQAVITPLAESVEEGGK